jgi:hypothetical protein
MLGTSLAQLLNRLKLGWILLFVIKCLIQSLMEICYHDLLFSISILDMCLSPHVVQKRLYRKTSVGETHRDDGTKFDREIHKLWKVINQGPCTTKRALRGYQSRPLGIPYGPSHLALCPQSGLSPIHSILICFVFRFEPNWKSHDKTFLNMRKDYFSHDLWIDSHNMLPGSIATIGNLLLGTPCYLCCLGMRYSRIRELDSWCLVIGEFYFKKKNE